MKVWQVATGEPGRDYHQLFFDYDVMILGPAEHGDIKQSIYSKGAANSVNRQVQHFANGPQAGDRVLLRFAHDVIAVGQIPKEDDQYSFNEAFKCIYGWNLRHCRRVVWAVGITLGPLACVFKNAKQKPSFTQVHESDIVDLVQQINKAAFDRPLKTLPIVDENNEYQDEELGVALFGAGISNRNIDEILKALHQAARLCAWYDSDEFKGEARPSEHEIISHVTLPIFLGLGWSHQQIAVEWNRVDVAFFKAMRFAPENCVMILEAKELGQALSDVLQQPLKYVDNLGLTNTRYILTTDGPNLFVYGRDGQEWNPNPIGYINFVSLQKKYLLPEKTNLVQTLVDLQPGMI